MANGINANLLRRWVVDAETGSPASPPAAQPAAPMASFVALPLPTPAAASDIRIELQRVGTAITVTWPSSAAADCATWLRELLR